jgi:hypothetical protein
MSDAQRLGPQSTALQGALRRLKATWWPYSCVAIIFGSTPSTVSPGTTSMFDP